MKVLVAGGAGFVGSNLVDRLLAEGHAVDVVDDLSSGSMANLADARADRGNKIHFHRLDLCDPALGELVQRSRPQLIFHVARGAEDDGTRALQLGALGTLALLEAACAVGCRKVVAIVGAAGLYARVGPEDGPVKEGHAMEPSTLAGVADKTRIELLRHFRQERDLEFTALALGSVYGPRQRAGGVVASFTACAAAGESPVVHGDGTQVRDFVYVDDAVDAMVRSADRGSGLLINVGTGVGTSIVDLHRAVAAAAGKAMAPTREPARRNEIGNLVLDPGRAAMQLGWKPWTGLAEGVALTLAAGSGS